MRSMPFIVDGNEYFSQGPAIDTIAIDEVNRNPGYVLCRCNGLVQCDRILGLNSLQVPLHLLLHLHRRRDTP